jgi:hypothetical protein
VELAQRYTNILPGKQHVTVFIDADRGGALLVNEFNPLLHFADYLWHRHTRDCNLKDRGDSGRYPMPQSGESSYFDMPLYQRLLLAAAPCLFAAAVIPNPSILPDFDARMIIPAYGVLLAIDVMTPFLSAASYILASAIVIVFAVVLVGLAVHKALSLIPLTIENMGVHTLNTRSVCPRIALPPGSQYRGLEGDTRGEHLDKKGPRKGRPPPCYR